MTSSSKCAATEVPHGHVWGPQLRTPPAKRAKRWMDIDGYCLWWGPYYGFYNGKKSGKIVIATGWHSISIITWKIWDYCGFIMDITWKHRGFMSLPTWRVAGVFFQNLAFAVKQIRENNMSTWAQPVPSPYFRYLHVWCTSPCVTIHQSYPLALQDVISQASCRKPLFVY